MDLETLQDNWNAYLSAYGATDADERARLLAQSVSEDVVFTNPAGDGETLAGLDAHIVGFQQSNPGKYFGTDKLFPQKDKMLAIWSMYSGDGTRLATGYNFVRPDETGRFKYLAGFF